MGREGLWIRTVEEMIMANDDHNDLRGKPRADT